MTGDSPVPPENVTMSPFVGGTPPTQFAPSLQFGLLLKSAPFHTSLL